MLMLELEKEALFDAASTSDFTTVSEIDSDDMI